MIGKVSVMLATLLAVNSAQAQTAPDKYSFDKSHTHIIFFIDHLGFSSTIGRVTEFDGYFTFDEKEPQKSVIDVTLNPASVDTGVPALDKELLGEKFFNVEKYKTLHFKSTHVEVTGGKTGVVTGNLTMLAATRPVTLQVTYNKSGIHPYSNDYISGFTVEGRFKRSDFGMVSYVPDVGDEVILHMEVEGVDPFKHPGRHDKKTGE